MDYEIKNGLIIGDTPDNANPKANFQTVSTDKGWLPNRMTTAQRLAIAGLGLSDKGLILFDTDLNSYFYWSGTQWQSVGISQTEPSNPQIGNIYFNVLDGSLKIWNGTFWQGAPVTREPFTHPSGDTIGFLPSVLNGGTAAIVSAIPTVESADINSADQKARHGVYQNAITTTASGFSAFSNASTANSPRYQLSLKGKFFIGFYWQQYAPITPIDFANDPVLACVGLVTYITTAVVNPLTGIYFRMPRLGESAFVKYVIREGGVETVFNTAIPVTTNIIGYVKTALLWDGLNDTMHFISGANGVYDTKSITSFSATYPTAFAALYHAGTYVARNGAGVSPIASGVRMDEFERYYFPNYLEFV